jgi:tetratricopeptide (TPR) repeat protein
LCRVTLNDRVVLATDESELKKMNESLRDATRSIGYIYLEVLRQPKMAEAEYASLVKNGNGDVRDYYNLGVAYLRNRKKTSAYQAFKKTVDLDPESEEGKDAQEAIEKMLAASREGFQVEAGH